MSEGPKRWLVEGRDGAEIGPISTEAVAQAILAGSLSYEVRVSAPEDGDRKWLRAADIPAIADLVEGETSVDTERRALAREAQKTSHKM
jgi:hypothetical protein